MSVALHIAIIMGTSQRKKTMYGDCLVAELRIEDRARCRNFVRMTTTDPEVLLQTIG